MDRLLIESLMNIRLSIIFLLSIAMAFTFRFQLRRLSLNICLRNLTANRIQTQTDMQFSLNSRINGYCMSELLCFPRILDRFTQEIRRPVEE